jgi:CheY-like chemotaxis protein
MDRAIGQQMTEPTERRKHGRIALKGTAILLAGEHAVRARLVNLSEGGFLATTLVTPPGPLLGRSVDIELRLDDGLSQWNRLEGKIVRIANESVAICFTATSALIRLVDGMTVASRARDRVISVILIDEDARRRRLLAEAFRIVGCSLIEAATSLEAIVRLGESSFEPDVIAVADSIPAVTANEMRDFVGRNHPHVKLVSITDVIDPGINIFQLTPEDLSGNLAGAIRRVLGRPRAPSGGG